MVFRNPGLGLGKTEGNDELAIWRNLSTNTAVDYFPAQRLSDRAVISHVSLSLVKLPYLPT